MIKKSLLYCMVFLPLTASAQSKDDQIRASGLPVLPRMTGANIPGAPVLGQPQLVAGMKQDIRTEKHGLVYPAFYDWNRDGKTDLLLGEFETGQTGSDVKVYLNQGTNKSPHYSGEYFYAKDTAGGRITSYQWCCIGTHPRLVDLDNDGFVDMLSGQYNPGQINWWPGSATGFGPRRFVEQEGYVEGARLDTSGKASELDPRSNDYWNYTSAGFGDFNGDGLQDLFVGGFGEMRVALNVGTRTAPKFGLRTYLLGVDGYPISVVKPGKEALEKAAAAHRFLHFSGVTKSFVTPYDWDGDGVLDLLVTHVYADKDTRDPVVFFRGVMTDRGLRFQDAVPLFTAEQAKKTFPGCQPNIAITDYNSDGVPDLVIGVSLPTVNGFEVDPFLSWSYLHELGVQTPGKDAGLAIGWEGSLEAVRKKIDANPGMKSYYMGKLTDYKYLTLRHRGYVYVMLGKANPVKARALQGVAAREAVKPPVNETVQAGGGEEVRYTVKAPDTLQMGEEGEVEVRFTFKQGWHGYAETAGNKAAGWIPTKVEFLLPKEFAAVGEAVRPVSRPEAGAEVYAGSDVRFAQKFRLASDATAARGLSPGEYEIKVKIQYQTCDENMCLPPVNEEVVLKVRSGMFE